jgi:hypothetical protein
MVEIVERENIIKKQFGGLTVKTRWLNVFF